MEVKVADTIDSYTQEIAKMNEVIDETNNLLHELRNAVRNQKEI